MEGTLFNSSVGSLYEVFKCVYVRVHLDKEGRNWSEGGRELHK